MTSPLSMGFSMIDCENRGADAVVRIQCAVAGLHVHPNGSGINHLCALTIIQAHLHELRVLIRVPESVGAWHRSAELVLDLLRQARQHGRPEQACTDEGC